MKIIEVRDGFINFEANDATYLSSFIQVCGADKNYIAQVNQLKKVGSVCIASAKILFISIDGILNNYDKTLPSRDADIEPFTLDILQNSINAKEPVILGKLLDGSGNIVTDASAFNKKMLISVDNADINNLLCRNLLKQFQNVGKQPVIIDTTGVIKQKKYTAGVDFKMPLNKLTLMFMYKSCLNDATADSKSNIVEIFNDLSEYSQTVPFVSFGALKSIVDDLVDKQHVFKLFVLKNRLEKFERLGYFATEKREVESLKQIISSKNPIIDLSKLDPLFMNCYLEYIYSELADGNVQVFLEMSNVISKKNLKNIIEVSPISSSLIVHSKYQYLNDIKNLFDNFIIEPTETNNEVFKVYNSFLTSMEKNMYLIIGEAINYIPVVAKAQIIDDVIPFKAEEKGFSQEYQENQTYEENEETFEQNEDIDESEDEQSDDFDENIQEEKYVQNNDEIIANIEEKSENVINSVAQSLENDPCEVEIFEEDDSDNIEETLIQDVDEDADFDDESEEDDDDYEDDDEFSDDSSLEMIEETQEEDIIEPEFHVADEIQDLSEKEEDLSSESSINIEPQELIEPIELEETESLDSMNYSSAQDEELLSEITVDNESDNLELGSDLESDFETDLLEESVSQDVEMLSASDSDIDETLEDVDNTSDDELSISLEESEDDLIQELQESDFQTEELGLAVELAEEPVETQVLELDDEHSFDEIVELDPSDTDENDIIIDISDEADNINIDEEVDKQIVADVDKVYTTMKDSDALEEISDSDLDFIDELNSDGDSLEEFTEELEEVSDSGIDGGILEQPQESIIPERQSRESGAEILEKREANTPIVPVYDADIPQEDMVVSDPIQQGDSVIHAKYGNGVVEKMIKYGTKTLYSINFENIGRRLLDPTLTEIKKL